MQIHRCRASMACRVICFVFFENLWCQNVVWLVSWGTSQRRWIYSPATTWVQNFINILWLDDFRFHEILSANVSRIFANPHVGSRPKQQLQCLRPWSLSQVDRSNCHVEDRQTNIHPVGWKKIVEYLDINDNWEYTKSCYIKKTDNKKFKKHVFTNHLL